MSKDFSTYDVALSYAGEDREDVEKLADALKLAGMNVFYDGYEKANLWGKDLYSHLTEVYRDQAKFCILVISENYADKQWTNLERKAAQSRAFNENEEYILPLRLDDTSVKGVLDTTGYIDLRQLSIPEVVELVQAKVQDFNCKHGVVAKVVKLEEVFTLGGIHNPAGKPIVDSMFRTSCPTCGTVQTLGESPIKLHGSETVYECKNGCQNIAVIGKPRPEAWMGRGFRIGDFVLRNANNVEIVTGPIGPYALIPASRAALMKQRPGK